MIISWFSGGITSAVATKIALQIYKDVHPIFIETGGHHPDMPRFIRDCEKWFGVPIMTLQDTRFKDHMDLMVKEGYVNGPGGARCSLVLKKRVRQKFQKGKDIEGQVFGFEYAKKEINRAIRFKEQNPDVKPLFPLIEKKLNKAGCMVMVEKAGIKLPEMYGLGYSNNNCVGCVKGGMGYWNKIRQDFPEVFEKMSKVERTVGHSAIKGKFLDELDPEAGRHENAPMPECDLFCEIEMAELESPRLQAVIDGCEDV